MNSFWNTSDVQPSEQFEYWRDVICDAFLPLEPVLPDVSRFAGSVAAVGLRHFHVASVLANAHTVTRTRNGIARTRTGGFFANLIRSGSATAAQAGAYAEATAGDIVLLDTDEPFEFTMSGACDVVCLTIPEEWLRFRLGRRGLPASPVVATRSGAGRLASHYLRGLSAEPEDVLQDLEHTVFEHLCQLLVRESATAETRAGERDVLRARIVAYIDAHLADRALSVATASGALGLSRTFLYALLAEAGISFASEVRKRRLSAVDRDLRDPCYAGVTLADLAYRWGFDDASSFTRTYRAYFDATPKTRRAASIAARGSNAVALRLNPR